MRNAALIRTERVERAESNPRRHTTGGSRALHSPAPIGMLARMQLRNVIESIRELAPDHLAEDWDRVGLHIGRQRQRVRRALLCIDLTEAVVAEAGQQRVDLVVAYHPPIFKPLAELTDVEVKPRIALDLAERGIAVYSPHTALDAAPDGVNDWLAEGIGTGECWPIRPAAAADGSPSETAGQGRVVALDRPVRLSTLTQRLKKRLGARQLEVAPPQTTGRGRDGSVQRVGLCAGAGGSLLAEAGPVDAFFTGEMRHHDVLAATADGVAILLAGHTQTERPYLPTLRSRLRDATGAAVEWRISRADKAPSAMR